MSLRFAVIGILALAIGCSSGALHAQEIPELHHRVTDLSGTLSGPELQMLEQKLAAFEQQTSDQIVVLMISSPGDQGIEDYSMAVCEKNKLGKKGRDNGILMLISKDDHKIRIEVGYGLEGSLTDALSDQIIRRVIAPHFREGDFAGGISAGIDAIIDVTKGEFQGEGQAQSRRSQHFPFVLVFLFFPIFFSVMRAVLGSRRHYVGPGRYTSRGGWWWWSGLGGGGFGGGGFGGGGFGGGFSGGGGSFGGGGATGSW